MGLDACGAGGAGTAAPGIPATIASPAAATLAPASAAPALTVTGPIVSSSGSSFTIQAGSGCGYLTVVTNSATSIAANGLPIAAGTYAKATGNGTCSTQLIATSVALASSANGPFGTPAPAPSPSAAPSTAAGFTVTGPIASVSGANFTVQAGSGCGYLTIVTSKTTSIVTNGLSIAAGTYARATGSGSCATQLTATSVVLASSASGPFGTPSAAPSTAPTPGPNPSPVPTPVSAPTPTTALSAANYTQIVNGQPWPSNFRPFAANSPVNSQLPASPANVDAAGTSKFQAYLQRKSNPFYGVDSQADGPVYAAHASDQSVSLSISQSNDGCPSQIRVPSQARAPGSGDRHMSVIQPDGSVIDFWLASYSGGSTLSAAYCENVPGGITGSSLTPSGKGVTDGNALMAELIRFNELTSGTIPHALRTVIPCVNGIQPPVGSSNGVQCADGAGIAMGTRFYLNLSDAQIDALPSSTVQPYMRPILHALHQYGAYVTDTGFFSPPESNNALNFVYESGLSYYSFGVTSPGAQFAASHGFANNGSNWIDNNTIDWPSLASHIVVVSNCYAYGTCSN